LQFNGCVGLIWDVNKKMNFLLAFITGNFYQMGDETSFRTTTIFLFPFSTDKKK
jgi:hypothetical protein